MRKRDNHACGLLANERLSNVQVVLPQTHLCLSAKRVSMYAKLESFC